MAVVFSLLVFPASLSLVLVFWFTAAIFLLYRGAPRWAASAILMSVFCAVLKGPFVFWLAVYAVVAIAFAIFLSLREQHPRAWQCFVICGIVQVAFSVDRYQAGQSSQTPAYNETTRVVCIGDSLTSGLPSIGGYPADIGDFAAVEVVDLGREGITADEALPMLAAAQLVAGTHVIVELGGHDFLKKQSRASTKRDLGNIIEQCQIAGCHVLLCEIPRGFIVDPFFGLERELAREYDLSLMSDTMIRKLVLFSPYAPPGLWITKQHHYSNDGLHPNTLGNRMMARELSKRLNLPPPNKNRQP